MSSQVKKNKNKERNMCHHGLIKMLIEHELNQRGLSWSIFLWENDFIQKIREDIIETSPPTISPQEPIGPLRRITRAMQKAKQVQVEHEKEKEARVPNFQGLARKSRKSSNSYIGIDPNQKKLYDYINEKEERDKHPIYEEIKDDDNPTYQ